VRKFAASTAAVHMARRAAEGKTGPVKSTGKAA
jgi:hypothetical protein